MKVHEHDDVSDSVINDVPVSKCEEEVSLPIEEEDDVLSDAASDNDSILGMIDNDSVQVMRLEFFAGGGSYWRW